MQLIDCGSKGENNSNTAPLLLAKTKTFTPNRYILCSNANLKYRTYLHYMPQLDLSNCAKEAIHIPGKIQSHGFFIAIDESFNIIYCSENIVEFISQPATTLLNEPIEVFESLINDQEQNILFRPLITMAYRRKKFQALNPYELEIGGREFNMILSKPGALYFLDFEPELSDLSVNIQPMLGRSLSAMVADKDLGQLLHNGADQIKEIIGYDRVMIYKFHQDGHGEVVAEAKEEQLNSWLGLHYPATDIPEQARQLYKVNLTRLIADVEQEPSSIITSVEHNSEEPLDLTCSTLRAVSPVHIQYLKNMGVASSFSISIVNQDQLWGLVACHSYVPRFINFRERDAAKLVGHVLSSAINFREQEQQQQLAYGLRNAVDSITRNLLRNVSIEDALLKQDVTLLNVVPAGGAVLQFEGNLFTTGTVPSENFVRTLISWVDDKIQDNLYYTPCLSMQYPEASKYKDCASGLLVCRLSGELKEYILWFRPEVLSVVNWAGNPEKPATYDHKGGLHISPRTSFEVWSQHVSETSISWEQQELSAAQQLRYEINLAISRRAIELRALNEKLREAYAELDTFSYTISHDLKNPLTTIRSYAQLIGRYELEPKLKMMFDRIQQSASKMQQMIEEVLAYSKAGQSVLSFEQIDMGVLLTELTDELLLQAGNPNLKIFVHQTPDIKGEKTMIYQVFANLLSNAVKYSNKAEYPIVTIKGEVLEAEVLYTITDNGVGIPKEEQESVFELFTRAQTANGFDGTGVGLAIVKKIVDRHNGRIWIESDAACPGTKFLVAFSLDMTRKISAPLS